MGVYAGLRVVVSGGYPSQCMVHHISVGAYGRIACVDPWPLLYASICFREYVTDAVANDATQVTHSDMRLPTLWKYGLN